MKLICNDNSYLMAITFTNNKISQPGGGNGDEDSDDVDLSGELPCDEDSDDEDSDDDDIGGELPCGGDSDDGGLGGSCDTGCAQGCSHRGGGILGGLIPSLLCSIG